MNSEFSRIITLLRKEKKLSQKQAACDLGISQALLSHYEKGIRECGLDFVIKTADYYNVSCDYLLGRTTERNGAKLTVDDISADNRSVNYGNILSQMNKRLIHNSIDLIFEILSQMNNKEVENDVTDYMMTTVYRMFRLIYSANPQNPQALFSIPISLYGGYSNAFQSIKEIEAVALTHGVAVNNLKPVDREKAPLLSQETLAMELPLYSTSMLNVIKLVENNIKQYQENK